MPTPKLQAYLDENGVAYESFPYEHAYDAQRVAAAAHVSGRELVKTVMVKAGDRLVMAVVPADKRVDCERLKQALGVPSAEIAKERDFKDLFDDCEVGAMPPFGGLYGVDVFVDDGLAQVEHIAFRGGTHHELVRMAYADFARLAAPQVLPLAYRR